MGSVLSSSLAISVTVLLERMIAFSWIFFLASALGLAMIFVVLRLRGVILR